MEESHQTLRPVHELLWPQADLDDKAPAQPHNQLLSFLQEELGGTPITSLSQVGKFLDFFYWKMKVPTFSVPLCQRVATICNYIFLFGEASFQAIKITHAALPSEAIAKMKQSVDAVYQNPQKFAGVLPDEQYKKNKEALRAVFKDASTGCWRYLDLPVLRTNLRLKGVLGALEQHAYDSLRFFHPSYDIVPMDVSVLLLFWGFSKKELKQLNPPRPGRPAIAIHRSNVLRALARALIPLHRTPLSAFELFLETHPDLLRSKEPALDGMTLCQYLFTKGYGAMKGHVSTFLPKDVDTFSFGKSYFGGRLELDLVHVSMLPEILPQLKSFTCGATVWTVPAFEFLLHALSSNSLTKKLEHLELRLPMDILAGSSDARDLLAGLFQGQAGTLKTVCLHCEAIRLNQGAVESWHRECQEDEPWVLGTKACFQAIANALSSITSSNSIEELTITGCVSQLVQDVVGEFCSDDSVGSLNLQPSARHFSFETPPLVTRRRVNMCNFRMDLQQWLSLSEKLTQLHFLEELIVAPPEPYWVLPLLYLTPKMLGLRVLRLKGFTTLNQQHGYVNITAPLVNLIREGRLHIIEINQMTSFACALDASALCEALRASSNTVSGLYLISVDLIGTDVTRRFLSVLFNDTKLVDFMVIDRSGFHYGRIPSLCPHDAARYKSKDEAAQVAYFTSLNWCGKGKCRDMASSLAVLLKTLSAVPYKLRRVNEEDSQRQTRILSHQYSLLHEALSLPCLIRALSDQH